MELLDRITENGTLVIECRGDNLDASNVRDFRETMKKLMKDHTHVVLDMSQMKFVDSSGLGALIACLRDANGRKGDPGCGFDWGRTVAALGWPARCFPEGVITVT